MRISDLSSDVCSSDLVVRDDAEAEDVVQEAYTHAFAGLSTFRGESSLSTWLTRIVLNEANGRLRRRRPSVDIATFEATPQEIGRASCRERGGTYVEHPVVPVSSKKKKTSTKKSHIEMKC